MSALYVRTLHHLRDCIARAEAAAKQLDVAENVDMPGIFGDLGIDQESKQEAVNAARLALTSIFREVNDVVSDSIDAEALALMQGGARLKDVHEASGIAKTTLIRRRNAQTGREGRPEGV